MNENIFVLDATVANEQAEEAQENKKSFSNSETKNFVLNKRVRHRIKKNDFWDGINLSQIFEIENSA